MSTREELLARSEGPARDALRLHPFYHGKIQVLPKCPVRDLADFAVWYTPGVAGDESILPRMDEWDVVPRIAAATAREAERSGLAADAEHYLAEATQRIRSAREATEALMRCGVIAEHP